MKEKKRNVYLRKEEKLNIVSKFLNTLKAGDQFGYRELEEFLRNNYEWFITSSKVSQQSRLWGLAEIMREYFSKNLERTEKPGFGVQAEWTLISKEIEVSTEKKEVERKPRRCSIERLKKFYLIIKKASESKIGISKKDVERIMEYETPMTIQNVNSLNEQIESETGYEPLIIDKKHTFVGYDILQVNKEVAEMVLDELREKLEGQEPEMPMFEGDYESIVKSIIRKDYYILSMFAKSNTILYKTGDMDNFRDAIVTKSITLGIDKIADIFNENLKKRYNIDLKFICGPRKYVTIVDDENNSKIKQALIKIETIFTEYFCEDIVDPERTFLAKENQKESVPDEQEQSLLDMIEYAVFKGTDGELFLSELWKRLDLLNVTRGWKILDVLKKSPEKFKVINKRNPMGVSEDLITYTAPKEEPKVEKEEAEIHEETTNSHENQICKAIAAFKERMDLEYFCRNGIEKGDIEVHNDELFVEIRYDRTVKSSVRAFLKLYYASLRSSSITVFFVKESDINELENLY